MSSMPPSYWSGFTFQVTPEGMFVHHGDRCLCFITKTDWVTFLDKMNNPQFNGTMWDCFNFRKVSV